MNNGRVNSDIKYKINKKQSTAVCHVIQTSEKCENLTMSVWEGLHQGYNARKVVS